MNHFILSILYMYLIQSVETKYISNIHEYASQSYTLKNKNNMHV